MQIRKFVAVLAIAATTVVGAALPASAHHIVGISVQASCEGYSGEAVLNVFGNHSYQVTAPGFDSGVVTEPGSNHNVTVPFSGTATSGVVTATIWNGASGTGGVEATQLEGFGVEENCQPDIVKPRARFLGPCGDPMYAAVLDNSRSNVPVTFTIRFVEKNKGVHVRTRVVKAGHLVITPYTLHALGGTRLVIRGNGVILRSITAKHGGFPACP